MKNFEEFREAVVAYRLSRVIITALELDLFTVIGAKTWSVKNLAKVMKVSERGLDILLRNLATSRLLRKRGRLYRNSPFAATELDRSSSHCRSAYLDLLKDHYSDWARLTDAVRSGMPVTHDEPEDDDYRRRFTWAMHHRSVDIADKVAGQVSLRGARTLLDLGGGPGTYAIAFLKKYQTLRATVCDRPAAIQVAREVAATEQARARISYVAVDFMKDPLPARFDVIWYSNVLHIYSAEQNRSLFRRLHGALNPGGRLIIQDAFLHDKEGLYPADASLFAVTMLLFTDQGNTYSVQETASWLRQAGYTSVKPVRVRKGAEDWDGGLLQAVLPSSRSRRPVPRRRSAES